MPTELIQKAIPIEITHNTILIQLMRPKQYSHIFLG